MKKTHTLTAAELHLLETFLQKNEAFERAGEHLLTIRSEGPHADAAINDYNRASDERLQAAAVFASCVSASVKEVA